MSVSWQKLYAADIERIQNLLEYQLGVRQLECDARIVPSELQHLVPIAHLLGIGDDGVRFEASEMMRPEFAAWVRQQVRAASQEISEWVAAGPWNLTRSALLALTEEFGGPDPDADPRPPPAPETVAAMIETLRKLKL